MSMKCQRGKQSAFHWRLNGQSDNTNSRSASDEGQTVYVTLNQARENEGYWRQVKADAVAEIQAWQKKYKDICEFEVVFEAIAQIA